MQQLTHNQKKPLIQILEVPFPVLGRGQVLVRNHYSVLSFRIGENAIKDRRTGYREKVVSRKSEVKQVVEQIKKSGLADTYRMVMNRLEAPTPLGYSCAGEVIAVSSEISDIKVGDRVACGGEGAWHADVVAIFKNLCVRVPEGVDLRQAAFASIAAIAIQGVRQADLRFGERAAIIGLGLIGKLVIQVLQASGVDTIGIDIDEAQVQSAINGKMGLAINQNHEDLEHLVSRFTDGYGVDAAIITMTHVSADPIHLAGRLCRQKGRVVVMGEIPGGFDRAGYLHKELDLCLSYSCGPGRYDPVYEEKGVDYPIGYVRWTSNRNMKVFMDLLRKNKLQMDQLITHQVPLEEVPDVYSLVVNRSEPFCGIIIEYDSEKAISKKVVLQEKILHPAHPCVGFIGAGNFARKRILPFIKKRCDLIGVATAHGHTSRYVADKYGFDFCTGNADEIIAHDRINTVFITTRHNLHADYVVKAMTMNKHIFVEKPLAMTKDELKRIWETHRILMTRDKPVPILMVGFNRRFSPLIKKIKNLFSAEQPKAILYRINADKLPGDHWVHDPETGGGVIISEVCHFVDLALFLAGGEVTSISAKTLRDPTNSQDTLIINLGFENNSIATIAYFSNGNKKLAKEYLEVFCAGRVAVIQDFREMRVYGKRIAKTRLARSNMGYKQELIAFLNAVQTGGSSPIPFDELYATTLTTFAVVDAIKR